MPTIQHRKILVIAALRWLCCLAVSRRRFLALLPTGHQRRRPPGPGRSGRVGDGFPSVATKSRVPSIEDVAVRLAGGCIDVFIER